MCDTEASKEVDSVVEKYVVIGGWKRRRFDKVLLNTGIVGFVIGVGRLRNVVMVRGGVCGSRV